jgi:hypothetical protein
MNQRMRQARERSIERLKDHLVRLQPGTRFQVEWFLREHLSDQDAEHLIKTATAEQGQSARLIPGETSSCHDNSLNLATAHGWRWWYGLALSDDKIWRIHSWVKDSRGQIVETTELRTLYFGVPAETVPDLLDHMSGGN